MTESKPSSTLVTITDQLELKLLEIISSTHKSQTSTSIPAPFLTKCETYIANADALNLIRTILHQPEAIKSLLSLDALDDVISAFSILYNLLSKINDTQEEYNVCREIVKLLEGEERNIVLLFTLYNLRSRGEEKCFLLSKIISICASTPSSSLLLLRGNESNEVSSSLLSDMIQVDRMKQTLEEWGVSGEDTQMLYRSIVDAMGKISKMDVGEESLTSDDLFHAECMRQKYLLVIIETVSNVDKGAMEAAEEASLGAIRDPITLFHEQRGMLGYEPIKKLKTTNAVLYNLLNIFQVGTLEDYQSFLKQNPNAPQSLTLNPDDCLRHIRLLTFLSLASQGYKELPYQTIADKLQIPKNEVESWVISAVSQNLVTAKMDQLEEVVMVEKYLVRSFGFGTQEWKELHRKLVEWKEHVKYVLDGLKECDS